MLTERDQRTLVAIERQLRQEDPDLARRLATPTKLTPWRRLPMVSGVAAIVIYLALLIVCVLTGRYATKLYNIVSIKSESDLVKCKKHPAPKRGHSPFR